MDKITIFKEEILRIIEGSRVPEDPLHARDTLEWLRRLSPDPDQSLEIAALGHDIERALEGRKVRREEFANYEEFKAAHALNSAQILTELMRKLQLEEGLIQEVFLLVRHHESGGGKKVELLREADTLSFFHTNLPLYSARNSWEETRRRCLWGYRKLSARGREIVLTFNYDEERLNRLIRELSLDFYSGQLYKK